MASLAALALVTAAACVHAVEPRVSETEVARIRAADQARRDYWASTEALLSVKRYEEFIRDDSVAWEVAVQILPYEIGPERRLTLRKSSDNTLVATLTYPASGSLLRELYERRFAGADGTVDEVLTTIAVREVAVTEMECPGLAKVAREFEKREMAIAPVIDVALHGTAVSFRSRSWSSTVAWTYATAGNTLDERRQPEPIRWIGSFEAALYECVAKPPEPHRNRANEP